MDTDHMADNWTLSWDTVCSVARPMTTLQRYGPHQSHSFARMINLSSGEMAQSVKYLSYCIRTHVQPTEHIREANHSSTNLESQHWVGSSAIGVALELKIGVGYLSLPCKFQASLRDSEG